MWIIKIIKIKCFYPLQILDEHWCIYSCLQIPPRENWFQYVRRVYETANNFPCIKSLCWSLLFMSLWVGKLIKFPFWSLKFAKIFILETREQNNVKKAHKIIFEHRKKKPHEVIFLNKILVSRKLPDPRVANTGIKYEK